MAAIIYDMALALRLSFSLNTFDTVFAAALYGWLQY